jgi:sortase A
MFRSRHPFRLFISCLLIAGGAIFVFLGARDLMESSLGQSEAATDFAESIPPPVTAPVPGGPAVPATPAPSPPAPEPGDPIARLLIPRLDAKLYVLEGDSQEELRRGPGHLTGTAMPGAAGNCVIAGHRDTHFRILKNIRKGDDIVLETSEGQFLYRVKSTRVVSPSNTGPLQPTASPELNLITCFPFYYVGSAPKRFVVEARLAGAVTRTSVPAS